MTEEAAAAAAGSSGAGAVLDGVVDLGKDAVERLADAAVAQCVATISVTNATQETLVLDESSKHSEYGAFLDNPPLRVAPGGSATFRHGSTTALGLAAAGSQGGLTYRVGSATWALAWDFSKYTTEPATCAASVTNPTYTSHQSVAGTGPQAAISFQLEGPPAPPPHDDPVVNPPETEKPPPTPTQQPRQPHGGSGHSNVYLRRGSHGQEVARWQTQLNQVMGAGLAVDGDFGSGTETATKAFQQQHGLQVDGLVGPRSEEMMQSLFDPAAEDGTEVPLDAVNPDEYPDQWARPDDGAPQGPYHPSTHGAYDPQTHGQYDPDVHGQFHPEVHGHYHPQVQGDYHPQVHGQFHPEVHGQYHPEVHGAYHPEMHGPYHPQIHGDFHPGLHGPYDPAYHGDFHPEIHGRFDPGYHGPYDPQTHGQYHPEIHGPYDPETHGQYHPDAHGQYHPDIHGQFDPEVHGQYHPDIHGPYDPSYHGPYDPQLHGQYHPDIHGRFDPQIHGEYSEDKHGPYDESVHGPR